MGGVKPSGFQTFKRTHTHTQKKKKRSSLIEKLSPVIDVPRKRTPAAIVAVALFPDGRLYL